MYPSHLLVIRKLRNDPGRRDDAKPKLELNLVCRLICVIAVLPGVGVVRSIHRERFFYRSYSIKPLGGSDSGACSDAAAASTDY